jgi:hypothetical protein
MGFDDSNFFEAIEKMKNVKDSKKRKEILDYYIQKDVEDIIQMANQIRR